VLLATAAAILVGVVCTWPALFLYERALKAMAYLENLENSNGEASVFLMLAARYVLGISWMAFALVVFFGLPIYLLPADRYMQPLLGYILSFGVVWLLRFIPLNRRMRALGISPEQRGRQQKTFR
jgi:hypothetical protein